MDVRNRGRQKYCQKRACRAWGKATLSGRWLDWLEIFNNDTTLTSALLGGLLHHAETCVVEGKSYRAKHYSPEA